MLPFYLGKLWKTTGYKTHKWSPCCTLETMFLSRATLTWWGNCPGSRREMSYPYIEMSVFRQKNVYRNYVYVLCITAVYCPWWRTFSLLCLFSSFRLKLVTKAKPTLAINDWLLAHDSISRYYAIVCLSVRLSITRVDQSKTVEVRITQPECVISTELPHDSGFLTRMLVNQPTFSATTLPRNPKENIGSEAAE